MLKVLELDQDDIMDAIQDYVRQSANAPAGHKITLKITRGYEDITGCPVKDSVSARVEITEHKHDQT